MGFPSLASDYIKDRLDLNKLCGISPTSQRYDRQGDIYVIDRTLAPGHCDVCHTGEVVQPEKVSIMIGLVTLNE